MKNLRRWELDAKQSALLTLAADARLSLTDYFDDQTWRLRLGDGDVAALAIQTQYGGRAGLISLVPMWEHDGHFIYEAQTYEKAPIVTQFAPNFIQLEGKLTSDTLLTMRLWAMDSHTIGGAFVVENTSERAIDLRFDLYGHVIKDGKEQPLSLITMPRHLHALALGEFDNLEPVVIVEDGNARDDRPKIGTSVTIKPKQHTLLRWVHVGLGTKRDSLNVANQWLEVSWSAYFQQINAAAKALPQIQTGNRDWDWLIAASYNQVAQSFFTPAGHLPKGTFAAKRRPSHGYSQNGDGSDYPRGWDGQDPMLAYLTTPPMASIDPMIAQGIIHNYLATQADDGSIDNRPGTSGIKQEILCPPILARIAWHIFQQSEDDAFLQAVFPGLMSFLERWLATDIDGDGDGHPEWQDERQMGYIAFPTFATWQTWSQGADIRMVEGPDLVVYLIAEAMTLHHMAEHLGKKSALPTLNNILAGLRSQLEKLWLNDHFVYRDRDTHITTTGSVVLQEGAGDQRHDVEHSLLVPNRLIVRIVGGVNHVPRIRLHIEGRDDQDQPIEEVHTFEAFKWQNRQGLFTSHKTYSKIDSIWCEGLSRVYKINVCTLDTTQIDINTLLPLWIGALPEKYTIELVKLATDPAKFWQPNGITMVPVDSPHYDPSNARGAGGIWPFWLTLIGEGLIAANEAKKAGEMFKNLLQAQLEAVKDEGRFGQFYHAEKPQALGEKNHLAGIVPLHLLNKLLGIRIVGRNKVWVGGAFGWDRAVTIRQHGVIVRRTRKDIKVKFPSGYTVELEGDARWQAIIDPNGKNSRRVKRFQIPEVKKQPITTSTTVRPIERVNILIEYED